jgi:hypothetical protein
MEATLGVSPRAAPKEDIEAAILAGAEIGKAANSFALTAIKEKGLPSLVSEALVNQ